MLNPGSVGCPAYQDPGDEPHVSEAGSPHARYAVARTRIEMSKLARDFDFNPFERKRLIAK